MSILRNVISAAVRRLLALRRDDRGFVVLTTLSIFLFLFVMFSAVYAVGDTVHQRIRLQNACDAAAYSAAVVQADGLSRMATVNKALAWTYVQTVNRQMDAITYRWLKLVDKRFQEDRANARAYCKQIIFGGDWEHFNIYQMAFAAVESVGLLRKFKCSIGNHKTDPNGWWCGLYGGQNGAGMDKIHLNGREIPISTVVEATRVMEQTNGRGIPMFRDNEEQLKKDRKTLELLNGALEVINKQMNRQMKEVAHFVLRQSLRENRSKEPLKNVWGYFYIPSAESPYDVPDKDSVGLDAVRSRNYFSPLYNTEPCERLFLQMASQSGEDCFKKLQEFFPIANKPRGYSPDKPDRRGHPVGFGLDQWFFRGNDQRRTEGELGLQRSYKSANLNETGAGLLISKYPVARGNHLSNIGEGEAPNVSGNGLLAKIFGKVFHLVFSMFGRKIGDILPSSGNVRAPLREANLPGMCSYVSDTTALVAEYNWASGKWVCATQPQRSTVLADYLLCRFAHAKWLPWRYKFSDDGCRKYEICCDEGAQHSFRKKRHGFRKKKRKVEHFHYGYGHFHCPKWFCGFSMESKLMWPMSAVPPLAMPMIKGPKHGYMKHVLDLKGVLKPQKPLYHGKNNYTRGEYESCAVSMDADRAAMNSASATVAGLIKGHARIYGDDKEIYSRELYEGSIAKPWVLNRRFFCGAGTIVVGAAMKHENPLVRMMSKWNASGKDETPGRVFGVFNPVRKENMMWTMSAARAAYRKPGAKESHYSVSYDGRSDPSFLKYKGGMFVLRFPEKGSSKQAAWERVSDPQDLPEVDPLIIGGCCCSSENASAFRGVWNLCVSDWSATLLPLQYAGHGTKAESDSEVWALPKEADRSVNTNPFDLDTVAAMAASGHGTAFSLWDPLWVVEEASPDRAVLGDRPKNSGMTAAQEKVDTKTVLPDAGGQPDGRKPAVDPRQLIKNRVL